MAICILSVLYVWTLYNIPILAVGVRHLRRSGQKGRKASSSSEERLPTVSIIVPARDEEKVIGRIMEALLRLDYPIEKREIVVVEEGSRDDTVEICREYARQYPGQIRLVRRPVSNGKPSALNYALQYVKGEIVAFFDADNVPEPDALMKVIKYFEDPKVAAVQGRTLSINSEENMLTKFVSYEEAVWCEAYLRGKDVLDLFVHLKGSCQFIRHGVLEELGGFSEDALSEDMEFSAKLAEKGYRVRYASDVRAWQEGPAGLRQLFGQRTRWFRGTMDVAFKYGRLMAKLDRKSFDAEATLFGPFILIASLIGYLVAVYGLFAPLSLDVFWQVMMQFTAIVTTLTLFMGGLALIYASKPRKMSSLLWLPFIYFYWSLQAFIAFYAALLILLRRPREWVKTEKKGIIANASAV